MQGSLDSCVTNPDIPAPFFSPSIELPVGKMKQLSLHLAAFELK